MPQPTPAAPDHACPLCGGANRCAVAASRRLDTPCWCRDASFDAALLARVPEAQRSLACICAACVRTHQRDTCAATRIDSP